MPVEHLAPRPPADFDPTDQAFLADPVPMLRRLRDEHPIFFSPELGFWGLSRYDDITAALADFETFSNGAVRMPPLPESVAGRVPGDFFSKAFIAMDPPEHTRYRKVGNRGFTRGRMAQLEEPIREIADRLIDTFVADGRCDLMEQYGYALTVRTIMLLLGLPEDDVRRMRQLADDFPAIVQDGIDPMAADEREERWQRMAEVREDFARIVQERRRHPGDDIVSEMAAATDEDGGPLFSTQRLVTHMTEMIFGGTDTTANLMGFTVMLLDRHPEQAAAVRAQPELIPNAIEEVLRRRSPTIGIFKTTTRDVEVRGITIPAGSLVWLAIASAALDEHHFPDPERFDIHRPNAKDHVTFGKGRHFCIGAPLSRVEAKVGLETLFRRLPGLRLVPGQELEFQDILLTNVMRSLWVEWDAEAR
jgi:cytochrome P450